MNSTSPLKFQFGVTGCSSHTIPQFLDEVRRLLTDKSLQPRTLLCLNAHIYNLAVHDAALRRTLDSARVTTADGMAIVWAARFFGVPLRERCNQTEAFRAFLADATMPPASALLMGCSPEEAQAAARVVTTTASHCRVLESASGFLSDAEYRVLFARHTETDLILLGLGTPRTEQLAALAAETCPRAVVWHIGAGTIRILAGTVPEAPALLRRIGLQWLFRLWAEPRALWKRYLVGNPLFTARITIAGLKGQIGKPWTEPKGAEAESAPLR
jgi:exopolysaccharide biosynthesis WecB/TagA/CpsF family protein